VPTPWEKVLVLVLSTSVWHAPPPAVHHHHHTHHRTIQSSSASSSSSSSSSSIFKESYVSFHNKEDGYNIYEKENTNKFGVFTVEIENTPINSTHQKIHSENDMSGSMEDMCKDGRSKMQHLNLTLKNIVSLLSDNADKTDITMTISGFDDKLEKVIEPTKIEKDPEQVTLIHNKINSVLKPRGATNIGIALNNAKTQLQEQEQEQEKEKENSFIMMTDGQITAGESDIEKLKDMLPEDSDNYFIGFGGNHDFRLLQNLAKKNMGSYFYLDMIENAGLVFGEIIHAIMFPALKNGSIETTNGEIYDFMKNEWTTSLKIPTICSEQKKHFHIRSSDPNNFNLTISGKTPFGEEKLYEETLPELVDSYGKTDTVDLRKYMYRQKTLELLAEASELIEDETKTKYEKTEFKKTLTSFITIMQEFSDEQSEEADKEYMKQLCDDLYICKKTLFSYKSLLYTRTRQCAQGRESSYNTTQIEDEYCKMKRQNACVFRFNKESDDEYQEDEYQEDEYQEDEYQEDDEFEISVCPLNRTNTTPGQLSIMRTCSGK